jgi:RNA polymerase sigma-70 factor (ECF subfamily)
MTLSDGELVRRARGGDTLAMAQLLDRLEPYVARICGPIALSSGPDAAQETLIAVFRGLRGLSRPEALHAWVRAIAVREAVRVARRDQKGVPADLTELPARGDPQLAVDVRDVLRRLSPKQRAILVLRDIEGLDEKAVASILDVPMGTVKSRLARARASFRKAWSS